MVSFIHNPTTTQYFIFPGGELVAARARMKFEHDRAGPGGPNAGDVERIKRFL